MIRVAIIAGVLHTGGKRNLIMEYYRHIDREKIQFDFLCLQNSNGIQEDEINSLGGRVYRLPSHKMLFANLWQTYRILKRNNYQVMHAFDNTLNVFPLFAGKLAGVPLRISESVSKGNKKELKTMAKYVLRLFSHRFATHYFANSTESAVWQFGKRVFDEGKVTIFSSCSLSAFGWLIRSRTENGSRPSPSAAIPAPRAIMIRHITTLPKFRLAARIRISMITATARERML